MSKKKFMCRHAGSSNQVYEIEKDTHTFSKATWHIFHKGKKYYIVGLSDGSNNFFDINKISNENDFKNRRIFYSDKKMNHETFLKEAKNLKSTYPVRVILDVF